MKNEKNLYVRMKLSEWDGAFENASIYNIKLSIDCKSVGFLEVFDSLDTLRKEYGDDEEYAIVRVVEVDQPNIGGY